MSVENSGFSGVYVQCTKRNSMKNCNVSHSKGSGLVVANSGLMTIDGKATTIHHNCTGGYTDGDVISSSSCCCCCSVEDTWKLVTHLCSHLAPSIGAMSKEHHN